MAAFNWVNVDAVCPGCGDTTRLRCQVHVASDYSGDASGRFHDRDYELGQAMAWWPTDDPRFGAWRASRSLRVDESDVEEEACYTTCDRCGTDLYAILRFRQNTPERVVGIGREIDWPEGYSK